MEKERSFDEKSNLKMYILIRDSVPVGHAVNCSAHAGVAAAQRWGGGYPHKLSSDYDYTDWLDCSFKKVCCKVNDSYYKKAKTYGEEGEDWIEIRETNIKQGVLNEPMCLVFRPRYNMEKFFNWLTLYK